MLFQTVWLVDAIRVGARDRLVSIPVFCTFFWFAHDLGCVVRFDDWFNVYDHWFMKGFWVGLLSAVLLELVFFAQILRYGHREIAPTRTRREFAAMIGVAALGAILAWEYLRSVFDDPLYLASPPPTMLSYLIFGALMYHRRGGAAGQSVLMWRGYTGMAVVWWATTSTWFTDDFRSWQYMFVWAVCVLGGIVMTRLIARDRAAFAHPVTRRASATRLAA